MKNSITLIAAALLAGCAVTTTGPVARGTDGLYTITRQGEGFWVQPLQLTALATQEAEAYCTRGRKAAKIVHSKEIPAGALGRWPEAEVLFRCE